MKHSKSLFVLLVAAIFVPGLSFGQAKVGTTGVNFLKIGVSSRAVAMADAFLPISDDASALYYNPGGLVNIKNHEMIFTHVAYPAGINFDFIGGVQPLPEYGAAMGVSVTALYTDAMIETTPEHPYGTGRTFTATDFAAGISYSQRLTDKFSVGGTVRYIQEDLADATARGWGADVGTFYNTGWKSMRIAMLISNFGPDMTHITTPFPLPIVFKFGVAADAMKSDNNRVTVAIEGIHPNDNLEELHFGVEYSYQELASLRIGKKINGWKRDSWDEFVDDRQNKDPFVEYPVIDEDGALSMDGLTFGGGLNVKRLGFSVDYAYANIGFLGSIHRFSLGYRFGGR